MNGNTGDSASSLQRKEEGSAGQASQQALQDIAYMKRLIARNMSKLDRSPPYLFIWGTYIMLGLVGMQVNDTVWPIWFWSVGAVIGGALSALAGIKQSRSAAVQEGGSYGWMFWLPFVMVLLSGCLMMAMGIVEMDYAALFWMMLLGVSYVSLAPLAGKGTVILGIWFIVLSALTRLFFLDYQYLVLGLLGGGSIVVTGLLLKRRGRYHE